MKEEDAVLVVEAAGSPYAIRLDTVADIRDCARPLPGGPAAPLRFRGVAVPVYDLASALGETPTAGPRALLVLDLPHRLAAIVVDAVRGVRIPSRLDAKPCAAALAGAPTSACLAALPEGEIPVLDLADWLGGQAAPAVSGRHIEEFEDKPTFTGTNVR